MESQELIRWHYFISRKHGMFQLQSHQETLLHLGRGAWSRVVALGRVCAAVGLAGSLPSF